jgi:hypothetical protein
MYSAGHEQKLRRLGAQRRRAEQARKAARNALAAGVRDAVAAGMTQQAAARAAGVTQGLVWQYLAEAQPQGAPQTRSAAMNARAFARAASLDEYALRRWLRRGGVHAGHGHEHQLPDPHSRDGRKLIARFRAETGR